MWLGEDLDISTLFLFESIDSNENILIDLMVITVRPILRYSRNHCTLQTYNFHNFSKLLLNHSLIYT